MKFFFIALVASVLFSFSAFGQKGLIVSEMLPKPSGTESPFEYVELVATQCINFATTPYTVVFTNTSSTVTANGWREGNLTTYAFQINTGTVTAGQVVYVGGSSMLPLSNGGVAIRSINTSTTNGDVFGTKGTDVFGNGGSHCDGVAVFNVAASSITSSTVPVDAIFYGSAVGSSGSSAYELPVNDKYSGGKLLTTSFIAPDPATGDLIKATGGVYDPATGTFTSARTWALITTPSYNQTSITFGSSFTDPIPSVPTGINGSNCGTGTVTISASGSPDTYKWYVASTFGSSLATTASYTTPSISSTTTYYVTAVSTIGCESSPRTSVVATINPVPSSPSVTPGKNCGTGTVTLSASGSPTSYNWYSASGGGSSLATTSSYTTPSISSTTTYYSTAVSAAGCESSPRTSVVATINSIPSAPTGTNGSNCGTGTVTISVSGSPATYNWYTASSGGLSLATTASYTTPSISSTTTYYATAVSAISGCESSPRTPVVATINSIPSAPTGTDGSNCGTGTVGLSASGSPSSYNWYVASSGGSTLATTATYVTPSVSTTTTYYATAVNAAGCESTPRTAVVATINSIPSAPTGTNGSNCGTGSVTISASGSPATYNWYFASSGGSSLATTASYTTPSISSTTTYYATAVSAAGCESSPRTSVVATINSIPSAPTGTNGSNCGMGTVTISASGSPATYNWYSASSGGSSFSTTASYTTPSISSTTTYYATGVSSVGCESSPRTAVVATINSIPLVPTGTNGSNCGTGTVSLSASGSPSSYNWYSASSGGSSLAITASYTTPSISSNTTYYVTAVSAAGCESSPRTSVVASINSIPSAPTGINGSNCGTGSVTISTSGSPAIYNWYSASSGGSSLAITASYTTPSISSTTTYYATAVSAAGCESSPRTSVVATINSIPSAPTGINGSNCGMGTVTISASGSPTTYNWYSASSGGSSLATTASYTTPSISSTTTYYATAVSAAGCESLTRTSVVATINSIPLAPTAIDGSNCGTASVTISASGSPGTYNWYNASSGGLSLAITANYTTPLISSTTTYYATAVSAAGCESSPRIAIVATINSFLSPPTVTDVSNCGPRSVTISASGSPGTYNWYSASTGGSLLATNAIYTTPTITSTTTYYVTAANAFGCESSPRKAVVATINSIPSVPTGIDGSNCGTAPVTISASGSPATYNWYSASSGGSSLATTANYTTPLISSTTTYYATAVSAAGCESLPRTAVVATINSFLSPPTVIDVSNCGAGPVTITASGSPGTYIWYSVSTGGSSIATTSSFTIPALSSTTTYYVTTANAFGCESSPRTAVVATINSIPSAPIGIDGSNCGTGPVTISALGSPGTYNWYSASTGGASLETTSSYTTPVISSTSTYYVTAVSAAGCESVSRTAVNAKINSIPSDPTGIDSLRCGTGSVPLKASGSPFAYRWYDSLSGGSLLGSGSATFNSPSISNSTNFYVSALSIEGCESINRVVVTAVINPIPSPPIGKDSARCLSGSLTLVASGSSGSYNWYDVQTGGSSLGTNSNYTTPSLSDTTTYYVSSVSVEGCESIVRTSINAIINQTPPLPTTSDVTLCGPNTATLTASGSPESYHWYDVSVGGSPFANTTSLFTTAMINADTTYFFVSSVLGKCEGNRSVAKIIKAPVSVAGNLSSSNTAFCADQNAGVITLTGKAGSVIGWLSSSDNFIRDSTIITLTDTSKSFTNLKSTSYFKSIIKNGNCPAVTTNSFMIHIDPVTNPGILSGKEINDDEILLSLNGQVGTIAHWEVSRDSNFTTITNIPVISSDYNIANNNQLFYRVAVQSGLCAMSYSKFIEIDSFKVYHGISPNGDGFNDTWVVSKINLYPNNKVSIFNRWGTLIYFQEGYNNDDKVWFGQSNTGLKIGNNPVEEGTYFYHIDTGRKYSYTGIIELKR